MSDYCGIPHCRYNSPHVHALNGSPAPIADRHAAQRIQSLEAKVAELQKEKDCTTYAINMMRHDMAEANRIHNQQMNESLSNLENRKNDVIVAQAKEIERLTKDRDVLSRGLDIETAEIESLHKEIERLRKLARLRVGSGHGVLCCCVNCEELKNAIGGSK